jgi:hypothetical protein
MHHRLMVPWRSEKHPPGHKKNAFALNESRWDTKACTKSTSLLIVINQKSMQIVTHDIWTELTNLQVPQKQVITAIGMHTTFSVQKIDQFKTNKKYIMLVISKLLTHVFENITMSLQQLYHQIL